jgi:hypothetical protein
MAISPTFLTPCLTPQMNLNCFNFFDHSCKFRTASFEIPCVRIWNHLFHPCQAQSPASGPAAYPSAKRVHMECSCGVPWLALRWSMGICSCNNRFLAFALWIDVQKLLRWIVLIAATDSNPSSLCSATAKAIPTCCRSHSKHGSPGPHHRYFFRMLSKLNKNNSINHGTIGVSQRRCQIGWRNHRPICPSTFNKKMHWIFL